MWSAISKFLPKYKTTLPVRVISRQNMFKDAWAACWSPEANVVGFDTEGGHSVRLIQLTGPRGTLVVHIPPISSKFNAFWCQIG